MQKVEVTVLTNSLTSTDVAPVYAGYKESIKPLQSESLSQSTQHKCRKTTRH